MVNSGDGNSFELIKKRAEAGMECWSARELQPLLGYASWQNFANVIQKAIIACESAGNRVGDHFNEVINMIAVGKGAQRKVKDYLLTRHACFLIAMNGDPSHPEIAAAQTYFAIQTGKQEKFEKELAQLSADQKRVMLRNELSEHNKKLASAAKDAGVVTPIEYAHHEIGRKVRKTISDIGGTMPESLPPETSIKRVQNRLKKQIGTDPAPDASNK